MRKRNKNREFGSRKLRELMSSSYRRFMEETLERVSELEKRTPNSKCSITVETAAIDSIMLHFKCSKDAAMQKVLDEIFNIESLKKAQTYNSQIKIKGKPIILLIEKSRSWKLERSRYHVTLKKSYIVVSMEEITEKLFNKALLDAINE